MWIAGGGKLPVLDETSFMRPAEGQGAWQSSDAAKPTQPAWPGGAGAGGGAEGQKRAKIGKPKNPLCLPPARQAGKTEPMRSADRLTVHIIGAREDGERIARIRNRRCYGGVDWRHLGYAGARRRRRQVGQSKKRKRRSDAHQNGGSHWENRVKRQHGFDPQSFNWYRPYASARIAAVMARTA
jgi:hypothetical protein